MIIFSKMWLFFRKFAHIMRPDAFFSLCRPEVETITNGAEINEECHRCSCGKEFHRSPGFGEAIKKWSELKDKFKEAT